MKFTLSLAESTVEVRRKGEVIETEVPTSLP